MMTIAETIALEKKLKSDVADMFAKNNFNEFKRIYELKQDKFNKEVLNAVVAMFRKGERAVSICDVDPKTDHWGVFQVLPMSEEHYYFGRVENSKYNEVFNNNVMAYGRYNLTYKLIREFLYNNLFSNVVKMLVDNGFTVVTKGSHYGIVTLPTIL